MIRMEGSGEGCGEIQLFISAGYRPAHQRLPAHFGQNGCVFQSQVSNSFFG